MKRERTSYTFLMEMIWVCAFFLICASIFVMAFAKAEQISHKADVLNQAVQAASNVMEESFAIAGSADEQALLEQIPAAYSTDDFTIELAYSQEGNLLHLTVTVLDPDDASVIYSLTGARARNRLTEPGLTSAKGGIS